MSETDRNTRTLPPQRGLVKLRVIKALLYSVTAFASFAASGLKRGNGNGEQELDGTCHTNTLSSTSTTTPIPSGYNADADTNRVAPTRLLPSDPNIS
ncbi:hypothetical protein CR513_49820, partial [Mucuna pruriens]